jgi:hypothetical protein
MEERDLDLMVGCVGAYLGSNLRHLDGLERLSRFALLDAQSAGREKGCESLPYEI